jgi:hypothetical protein
MEMRGYGYGDALQKVKAVAPRVNANRVEYRRDGVTEWYENGPLGLEQGFTLAHRPDKANGQPLTLELALRGDLSAALEAGGRSLELRRKDGKAVLRYTGLKSSDATGRELRSWIALRDHRMLLQVEDAGAQYPVVVDPWTQQAELTPSDGEPYDSFGKSVAVSGSTIIVGALEHPAFGDGQGAAYVFVKSGTTWSQQAELTAPNGGKGDAFGWSVAVSGSTAVVGAYCHPVASACGAGAAYVFVESGGKWKEQAELTASDGAAGDYFGSSVAVSGSTVVVGAPKHSVGSNSQQGAAYVFVQSGTSWRQQAELTASGGTVDAHFGGFVAAGDGSVVVGAPGQTVGLKSSQGAAYVFVQSGTSWAQQAELTASDGAAGDAFGSSVAISAATVVSGAPFHEVGSNVDQGKVYVFVQTGEKWGQQAELTASDGGEPDVFGSSVAIDGSTVAVGAPGHSGDKGAAYLFVETAGKWAQQSEVSASDGSAGNYFGDSVGLSGNTSAVGAPGHFDGESPLEGAAYVFASSSSSMPAATPVFSPVAGTYTAGVLVTITNATSGAVIYYTTNGSTPTTSSTKYTGAIAVSATETIKAIAVATGYTNSAVASATYTIQKPAATPAFSPVAGTYTAAQSVTLKDATSGAVIYYTTNGSTPTTSSTKYTGAIAVSATETIKAIAVATGYTNSAVASATYTIKKAAATPVISPAAGNYTAAQ